MPSPRPLCEIYVHSPRLEGIHLRGGRVARGGIRWSDRHDDFRTEVLGLMKTQMVKNSVIVPVGSKGGFVLKGELPARPALDEYLIERYREYVSGLLDVTDNRADGEILHPPEVERLDGDDPYLVVAADKGTAHLSDTANSVSMQYGFWLGDAFASGGSAGYDHKRMGITARGAWECVKHHFRNLGRDIQTRAVHLRRDRRHVRRRVRQRDAALARDEAGRGLRPPPHLPGPRSRRRPQLPGAPAPVRPRALELAGLRRTRRSARAAASTTARPRRSRCRGRRGGRSRSSRTASRARSWCAGS